MDEAPAVLLGPVGADSVTPTVLAIVQAGVARRPGLARGLRARVVLRFAEDYPAVRLDFRGEEVVVGDDDADDDRACDLVIRGRMGDVNALIAAPLTGGLPRPTNRAGRAALARLADGRVDFDGPLSLARRVLRVLSLAPVARTAGTRG
jgi:hypothetical protein